jgi:hypothetical protein
MTRFYHKYKLFYRFNSVLYHNSTIFFTAALFLLMVSITSCIEKPTIIGSDLLPGTDFVNVKSTDTIGVAAYTISTDSIVTNSRDYSYLGRLYNPYFGDTRTDFVSQLRLTKPWPGGGPFSIDSVKLYFSISGAKGTLDSTTIHKLKIFEITEILNSTVRYYSNRDPNAGGEIGTFSLPAIPRDTAQSIEITLPNTFGEHLMRDTTKLSQDLDGNPFKSFFDGLYFTLEDSPDPILIAISITPTSADFFIRVYYHSNNTGSNLSFDFIINPNSVRYNRYSHDLTTANPAYRIKHINDGVKDSMIYLQAFNGVFPQLKIPGLNGIKKILVDSVNNVCHGSINKARLTFSVFIDSLNFLPSNVPPQILMKYTKSDTIQYVVPDYQVSASFFDGTINKTKLTYSFNLASFVQEYLKGDKARIKISEPMVEMYFPEGEYRNVILKANDSHSPVKFEFTYTRF